MSFLNRFILVCFSFLVFASCKDSGKTFTLEISDVKMFAEGPLFEGANTVQGEIDSPLAEFLKTNQLSIEQIAGARLIKATVIAADSSNFNILQSMTLQMATDNTDMIKLAVMNPVPADSKGFDLQTASEQEKFEEVLKQSKLYLVADAIVKQDTSANINFTCKLQFEISTK